MIEFNTVYNCFIKAVDSKYAENFFHKGEVYFDTLANYQKMEEQDSNIGDSKENILFNMPQAYIALPSKEKLYDQKYMEDLMNSDQLIPIQNALGFVKNNTNVAHCLCVSSFQIEEGSHDKTFNLDPKFISKYYGSRFFLILEYELYLNRIKDELQKLGYNDITFSTVEYFDESTEFFHKKANPFKKRDKYKYQNEYRILVKKDTIGPLTIHIGSLADIAIDITPLFERYINKTK